MSWRTKRRLIYLSIFFLIILLFAFLIYWKLRKEPSQCLNNRQDLEEEGIDCGGPCPPCELKYFQSFKIRPTQFLVYPDKTFDIIGLIENPNQNLALKKLSYQFLIYDNKNNLQITTPREETILLPLERRYLIKINKQPINFEIGRVDLDILEPSTADFVKIDPDKSPFTYYNLEFIKDARRQIKFTVFNNSYKIYKNIEIIVFLYNNDELIGLSRGFYQFKPQETKDIFFTLPNLLLEPTGLRVYFQKTTLKP